MNPEPWSNENFNIPCQHQMFNFRRMAICSVGTNDLIMLDINSNLSDRS